MPVVNPLARELVFKIVYYGPGLGGKTTTLQHIHATAKPEHRGKMVSLATPVDRTLYFDFLPIRVPHVRSMGVRLQLFTVPGQVYYNATRKLVLTGADGVVLVVDSQRERADSNLESLENLCDNLREHGRLLQDVPHVLAYNKRDLDEVTPLEEMQARLNRHGAPWFGTVATRGDGVYESLEAITRLVLEDFERRIPQSRELGRQQLELPEGGLAAALRMADEPSTVIAPARRSGGDQTTSDELGLSEHPEPAPGEDAARLLTDTARTSGASGQRSSVFPPDPLTTPSAASPPWARMSAAPSVDVQVRSAPVVSEVRTSVPEATSEIDVHPGSAPRDGSTPSAQPSAGAQPSATLEPAPSGASFAALWTGSEAGTARELERALSIQEYARAVSLADQLVARTLAGAAGVLGSAPEAPRDPATVVLLLGLEGRRYLEFRGLVRDARTGREVRELEALSAYAFAIQARLARMK